MMVQEVDESFFFLNDTGPTEISTLPLPRRSSDLRRRSPRPACRRPWPTSAAASRRSRRSPAPPAGSSPPRPRSEEHTSELQSRQYLVCRLLLEKKKSDAFNLTIL